jgi:hypothetical protein
MLDVRYRNPLNPGHLEFKPEEPNFCEVLIDLVWFRKRSFTRRQAHEVNEKLSWKLRVFTAAGRQEKQSDKVQRIDMRVSLRLGQFSD